MTFYQKLLHTLGHSLPPRRLVAFVVGFGALLFVIEGAVDLALNWYVGGEWNDHTLAEQFSWPKSYNAALLLGLGLLAVWRSLAFNPAHDESYYQWLRSTPYTGDRPLPMGDVHLMWQDALWVALAMCLWSLPQGRGLLVLAFALPYAACMAAALFRIDAWWSVLGAAALAVSLLLAAPHPPWVIAVVSISLAGYCDWAFRRALLAFPWDEAAPFKHKADEVPMSPHWPRLSDQVASLEPMAPWRYVLAGSALAGWAAFALTWLISLDPENVARPDHFALGVRMVLAGFAIFCAIFRFVVYADGHASPLGLWARIKLRRLIIPGYDRILIAPLAILALGVAVPRTLSALEFAPPIIAAVTVAVTLVIALGAPPTRANWSLTGHYRTRIRRQGLKKDWVQVA